MRMVPVGGRIPQELHEAMQAYKTETGQTDSEVVRDALALLLRGDAPEPVAVEKRLKRLESQMRKLQRVAMG